MFWGINMFWALLRAHFNPRRAGPAKMSLSRAQNIFMPGIPYFLEKTAGRLLKFRLERCVLIRSKKEGA